ncbi:MAG: alternative oxidase [Sideroxyarcus sp.]
MPPLSSHYVPRDHSDRAAYAFVRFLRLFADMFFARRYGHRAVVLETVAAVCGQRDSCKCRGAPNHH